MQDTKLANAALLAAQAQVDGSSVAREEGVLIELLDPVAVGLVRGALSEERSAEHEHYAVEKAVDNLETAALAAPGGGEVALVASPALKGLVLQADVGNLENLDGNAVGVPAPNSARHSRYALSLSNVTVAVFAPGLQSTLSMSR